ncbi:MAG: TRAP transporter small permease [Filomicrobium sp.]
MSGSPASHAKPAGSNSQNPIIRLIAFLSLICGVVAAFMIVIAVAITCQMIWIRFVMNQSTIWQTEAVVYLMIGATMIGLPYVQRLRGHVNVDLLPLMLPPLLRRLLAIVTLGLALLIIGVMAFYGFEMWHLAWERGWTSDTVWAVSLWIPYLALPIGFGLYFLQLAADLFAVLTGDEKPFGIED